MKNLISQEAYDVALQKGREALAQPHAVDARYNPRTRLLTVIFSNGLQFGVDVRQAPVLSERTNADLSHPYVTPGGDGLIFRGTDLQVGLPALVAPLLPVELARARVAAHMGSTRSFLKAVAARANGAKGGRPPRTAEPEKAKSAK